jgi:hypothetical protein
LLFAVLAARAAVPDVLTEALHSSGASFTFAFVQCGLRWCSSFFGAGLLRPFRRSSSLRHVTKTSHQLTPPDSAALGRQRHLIRLKNLILLGKPDNACADD